MCRGYACRYVPFYASHLQARPSGDAKCQPEQSESAVAALLASSWAAMLPLLGSKPHWMQLSEREVAFRQSCGEQGSLPLTCHPLARHIIFATPEALTAPHPVRGRQRYLGRAVVCRHTATRASMLINNQKDLHTFQYAVQPNHLLIRQDSFPWSTRWTMRLPFISRRCSGMRMGMSIATAESQVRCTASSIFIRDKGERLVVLDAGSLGRLSVLVPAVLSKAVSDFCQIN